MGKCKTTLHRCSMVDICCMECTQFNECTSPNKCVSSVKDLEHYKAMGYPQACSLYEPTDGTNDDGSYAAYLSSKLDPRD